VGWAVPAFRFLFIISSETHSNKKEHLQMFL